MSAQILSGSAPSKKILSSVKKDIKKLDPKLVIVQVGSDAASTSYIRKKMESCKEVGLRCDHIELLSTISEKEMLHLIHALNEDDDVSGFIIQLPLPKHLQKHEPKLFKAIDPAKDVDGFTAYNMGKIFLAKEFEHLPPATPAGIISLLQYYKISVVSKHVVIVGHSNLVGKPLAAMLLNRDATVTVCHHKTKGLGQITAQADILICAVGKPKLITKTLVKKGAVVIDVGTSQTKSGLKGDVDFEPVSNLASAITPVPGGVGPMTVASLIKNCVTAKRRQVEACHAEPVEA